MEDEGRKARNCPREEPRVNSASAATTGRKAQVKGKRPCVENPSSASASTKAEVTGGSSIFKPLSLCMDSSAYAYGPSGIKKRHCEDPGQSFVENPSSVSATTGTRGEVTGGSVFKPPSSAYVYAAGPEALYEFIRVRGRRGKEANKLFTNLYGIANRRMPLESGIIMPPQNPPREMLIDDPFYRKAVASGLEVEVRGGSWSTKPMGGLFYPLDL